MSGSNFEDIFGDLDNSFCDALSAVEAVNKKDLCNVAPDIEDTCDRLFPNIKSIDGQVMDNIMREAYDNVMDIVDKNSWNKAAHLKMWWPFDLVTGILYGYYYLFRSCVFEILLIG